MTDLYGLGTALITPFRQNGEVDYVALERLIARQVDADVDYIVVLGTTGEAATMTEQEKRCVCDYIISKVAGRLPLVLGVGGNCTANVVTALKQDYDYIKAHFSAILSVTPYYNKPSQEGIYRHFSAIAEASPVPVILYNVPGRTGVNMLPDTVMRIWREHYAQVFGIKEASGNISQIQTLIRQAEQEAQRLGVIPLKVISGDDGIAVEVMSSGGHGLISVASNAWPKEFGCIVRKQDKELQMRFSEIVSLLFKEGNPSGIKTVLAQMGIIENELRLPLMPNSQTVREEIYEAMKKI